MKTVNTCIANTTKYKRLMQLPLDGFAKKVGFKNNCKPDLVKSETCKFVALMYYTEAKLAPCETVDQLYHYILEDACLRSAVEDIVEGKLVHDSSIVGDELSHMYATTLQSYKALEGDFGESEEMWL